MKLSIIVVTWNNENYIEQALKSCISNNTDNYEVIVVHNASTDRTNEMIERAIYGHEKLFTIIQNSSNEGLGEGRNIGLNHAIGDYITFLDGDDFYLPEGIEFLLEQINNNPSDVILFGYKDFWLTGIYTKNKRLALLAPERDISSPTDRAKIVPVMGVAWNKIYKRSFILANEFKFTRRYYEDIDWHFSCLYSADTYYVTPHECIAYRHRLGSITRSKSAQHFDIIDQYKDVLSLLSNSESLINNYGKETYNYARGQIFNVFYTNNRLLHDDESKYLKESAKLLTQFRAVAAPERRDLFPVIAELGSPLLSRLARRGANLIRNFIARKKQLKRFKQKVKTFIKLTIYRKVYIKRPVDPKMAVFEAYWGRKIDCNPAVIAEALSKLSDWKVIWILNNPEQHTIPDNVTAVKRGTLRYYSVIARAAFFTSNVNFASHVIKRPSVTFLQTFHGTPIKKMGLDIRPIRPKEMNWRDFANRSSRWDVAISSNPYSTEVWRQSHPFGYKIIETGYPRNDALFELDDAESIKNEMGIPAGKKIAVYAPTFRQDGNKANHSLSSEVMDFTQLSSILGDEWVLLVRMHHLMKWENNNPSHIVDASDYHSVTNILKITDLLISDYSSIVFDYACRKKPIILYTYDYDQYVKSRGVYFDIRNEAPGCVVESFSDLKKCISNKEYASETNTIKMNVFHDKYCFLDDGMATSRVINEVFLEKTI